MGIFGPGLYSGDFAMDLRANISGVVRLPFEPEELVQILSRSNPLASDDPTNEEHTTFWLVVADQFAKRGIFCDRVREKAFAIIDNGEDIASLQRLGMNAVDPAELAVLEVKCNLPELRPPNAQNAVKIVSFIFPVIYDKPNLRADVLFA